jgi:hypothetical protein
MCVALSKDGEGLLMSASDFPQQVGTDRTISAPEDGTRIAASRQLPCLTENPISSPAVVDCCWDWSLSPSGRRGLLFTILPFIFAALAFAPVDPRPKAFVERFTVAAKDVTKGYRSFLYEATIDGCKAEVTGGRLVLRGDHGEGDQRLVVTPQKVTGKVLWPDSLEIAVKLGGTDNENIAWHVGVSVGRVKVLFHPNHTGGAFRAETVDTHEYFFGNEDMGFTPAADVMHEMTIRVDRMDRRYRFEVTLVEGKSGGKYRKTFEVSDDQMGRFDRISLERSGRRGGNALFESLSIKPGR